MPFYKREVISKTGQETFFFISKIIYLHYNYSYFKGLLLFQFSLLFPGFFRTVCSYISKSSQISHGKKVGLFSFCKWDLWALFSSPLIQLRHVSEHTDGQKVNDLDS